MQSDNSAKKKNSPFPTRQNEILQIFLTFIKIWTFFVVFFIFHCRRIEAIVICKTSAFWSGNLNW